MSARNLDKLPKESVGLRLARLVGEGYIICEAIRFSGGREAVDTVLRRAAISGRVEVGGDIADHLADVLDDDQSIIETVALDAASYAALKNKWMRCKVEYDDRRALTRRRRKVSASKTPQRIIGVAVGKKYAFERDRAGNKAIERLTAAGYRILAPGELDPKTVERCAEVAETTWLTLAIADTVSAQEQINVCREETAAAIRSLQEEDRS